MRRAKEQPEQAQRFRLLQTALRFRKWSASAKLFNPKKRSLGMPILRYAQKTGYFPRYGCAYSGRAAYHQIGDYSVRAECGVSKHERCGNCGF
jgi:hypothetical protein